MNREQRKRERRCHHECTLVSGLGIVPQTSKLLGTPSSAQTPEICPPSGGHFHLSRARMALAGTRNAKALAWNSGSLERKAQNSRGRVGLGAGTQTGGQGERDTERGTERPTHRDRDTEGQGQEQSRGKSLRPQIEL